VHNLSGKASEAAAAHIRNCRLARGQTQPPDPDPDMSAAWEIRHRLNCK
jgi:hypothetical protein